MTTTASPAAPRHDVDALCREHLPIVTYEVRALSARLPSHVATDDLTSAGLFALASAAESFDASRGVPFGRYAATRIKGALLDELRSMDWATRSVRTRARELDAVRGAMTSELGREPGERELADRLGVGVDAVRQVSEAVHRSVVVRLDSLVDAGVADAALPRDERTPEDVVVQRERESYLSAAVAALPERLRIVVQATFFEDRLLKDVAEELGVTESRVSQLRTEALGMLRDGMRATHGEERPAAAAAATTAAARRRAGYYADIAQRASMAQRGSLAGRSAGVRFAG
ncbi:sigma-70 family RNA polymerase sigma factor [Phycicoccus sp. MAQZ13P-2]|uniref:sigma-70 family RNA polymerase sigma factor n=1 Tax=Phycicoccus mangrovi TaxID=2840470 RepID=UPI001C002705|nr:sigma-70 family RNA polymerase sigma factor [Phycicoccus mangrovi]MBT9254929.1 sigma-70 family RNA polymerase sigma factor [Phycicoccus mangrovi]MBT9256074.1 sigma-70 family RNA polymerase sigma factor [Phycicoccus mangrovi]MBT9273913.1 sigma-70 family RNA polymerase sigma factor [Phycicoccus mangrovi]